FEYSTVDELAGYILKKWPARISAQVAQRSAANATSGVSAHEKPAAVVPRPERAEIGTTRFTGAGNASAIEERASVDAGIEPIAIIGMSGRFAESESLEAFWQHLAEGHDLVKKVSLWSPEACVMSVPADDAFG